MLLFGSISLPETTERAKHTNASLGIDDINIS